jgi:hypothetical protein
MSVPKIYPVITMPGKYHGLRALLWHFNGYCDSPDILIYFRYPTGTVITRDYCKCHDILMLVLIWPDCKRGSGSMAGDPLVLPLLVLVLVAAPVLGVGDHPQALAAAMALVLLLVLLQLLMQGNLARGRG